MSTISVIKLGGQATNVTGDLPKIGSNAPNFTLVDKNLQDVTLDNFTGKRKVLNIFPSIDTRTCATSVRTFNQHAANMDNTVVLNISADLPFAQGRFCVIEGIDKAISLSTMRGRDFMVNYGVLISSGPMAGLCARAVMVLDENNIGKHVELVEEIANEPNYQAALNALK